MDIKDFFENELIIKIFYSTILFDENIFKYYL